MIPKSGHRFSEKIMPQQKNMIPKSGHRFSEAIMLNKTLRNGAGGSDSWPSSSCV
jgi:hypothetical protein